MDSLVLVIRQLLIHRYWSRIKECTYRHQSDIHLTTAGEQFPAVLHVLHPISKAKG